MPPVFRPEPRPRPGRAPQRRNEQARLAILHAADDLLVERGFDGVTVEGIAAKAGVAKQTIYRWWPSKTEILLDTLGEDAARALAVKPADSVREELRQRLTRLATFLRKDPAGQVLLALIGAAQHDAPTAARLQEEFFAPQRAEDRTRIRRGIKDGELARDLRVDEALDALYGPVYLRALTGGPAAGPAFVARLLDATLTPAR